MSTNKDLHNQISTGVAIALTAVADGGVGWVVLRDGKTAADLRVLLRPWWDSLTYVGGGDFAEESREEFIRNHRLKNAIYGGYGTDKDSPSFAYIFFSIRSTIPRDTASAQIECSPTRCTVSQSRYLC